MQGLQYELQNTFQPNIESNYSIILYGRLLYLGLIEINETDAEKNEEEYIGPPPPQHSKTFLIITYTIRYVPMVAE